MICEVCRTVFTPELSFSTLFHPRNICPDCLMLYRPGRHLERIPYAFGVIDYVSVYDFENPDYHQEMVLYRYMDKCFNLAIFNHSEYDLVLLIGEHEFERLEEWFPLIRCCRKVLFLSLFYHDFIFYEDLM
jgi:hypothetical protein